MVIGVNGATGQRVTNLVALDFRTDHELVTTLHQNTEEIIALGAILNEDFATNNPVQVWILFLVYKNIQGSTTVM